jgi:hypothetical protein
MYTFFVLAVLLVTSAANAQKRVIGHSPPGPLGKVALTPDTQPPTIQLTETTGVLTRGEGMEGVKVLPVETRIMIRGVIEDNQEVVGLKVNNQMIPLVGATSRKTFGVKLPSPTAGRMSKYEFVAFDRSGNEVRQTYQISRPSAYETPVLAIWGTPEETSPPPPETVSADSVTPPPPSPQILPKIWLFAIGISKFQDPTLNLSYAASDASSFYEFFRSDKGARLPKTQATLLVNSAATRAEVIQSLTQAVKIASERDLVVIFLATHGLPDSDTGEINFLMHDTDIGNLVATGLSHSDLSRIIERSRSKKILFIVDACHSGELGAGRLLASRGITFSEVNRLLSMLAKASDGVAMLTASSSNEASFEGDQWNGGVFTYYLLAGLNGRADFNKDQIVTLREAFDYLYQTVPQATQGRQHPELKGQFSNELPLVEVNP